MRRTILRTKSANRHNKIEIRTYENYLQEDLSFSKCKDKEFLSAVSLGLNSRVKKIIKTGRCNLHIRDQEGGNAIHLAAQKNDTELLRLICEKGVPAGLKKRSNPTVTPFMIAAKHGCKDSLEYLHKEARVDIHVKDSEGQNATHYAAIGGNLQCFMYLITNAKLKYKDCNTVNGNTVLHLACQNGGFPIVRYACEVLHLDPHQYNYEGISTLRLAVQNNNIRIVMYLVSVWNVNMFLPDDHGISPIAYAASYDHLFHIFEYFAEIVQSESLIEGDLLLSRSIDDPPLTPLKAAIKYRNEKVIQLIFDKTKNRRKLYVYWISQKSHIMKKLSPQIIKNLCS